MTTFTALTKADFKARFESNDVEVKESITFGDMQECAKVWGLYNNPENHDLFEVRYNVLKAADVSNAEDYNPNK